MTEINRIRFPKQGFLTEYFIILNGKNIYKSYSLNKCINFCLKEGLTYTLVFDQYLHKGQNDTRKRQTYMETSM